MAEQFKNEGNNLYKSGEYRKSIDLYTKAIELCPSNAAYYGNRAAAYMMIQKHKLAIEDSKLATGIDPTFVKVSTQIRFNCLKFVTSIALASTGWF